MARCLEEPGRGEAMKTPCPTRRQFSVAAVSGLILGLGGCAPHMANAHFSRRQNRQADKDWIKSLVVREAANIGVSISLALAVAHVESNFDPNAQSNKGARGVMQIMPATARGEYAVSANALWNPRTNIRLGLHYLNRLIERYDGQVDFALSFYNGGSRVGPPSRPRIIPATRSYVRKVKRLRAHYRRALVRGEV